MCFVLVGLIIVWYWKKFCDYVIVSEIFKRNNCFLYESNLFVIVYCDVIVKYWYVKLFICV